MTDQLDGAERAMDAVMNQFATMCHERWLAAKRIRALKAEMARRAEAAVMDDYPEFYPDPQSDARRSPSAPRATPAACN
jgi:hypothetical protein